MMSSRSPAPLLVEVDDSGVAQVTLNDPSRRNAVTAAMRDAVLEAFDDFEGAGKARAVVITGAGSAFCSGADLGDLATADSTSLRYLYDAFLRIAASALPTVAAVNGPAVGAGLNLALACDIRLAARSARFATGFLRLGLHPGGGNTWLLQRAVGQQMMIAMTLFGEELDGEGAAACGLALRCVGDDTLTTEALELARRAVYAPGPLVARIKQTVGALGEVGSLSAAVDLELESQAWSTTQDFFLERIASGNEQGPGATRGSRYSDGATPRGDRQ
jgi:enoyl-CoA hydratase